jgi:CrcB protein
VVLGVGALGGAGALARFLIDGAVSSRSGRSFPLGTMLVNVSGSLALGVLVGAAIGTDGLRLFGTGLLGGYTTFSTWVFESHRLAEEGEGRSGALNLAGSLLLGLLAAWAGRKIGIAL